MGSNRFKRHSHAGLWVGVAANVLAALLAAGIAARLLPLLQPAGMVAVAGLEA
jgi:hypothetical protein